MNREQLDEVVKKHKAWLNDEKWGKRANFSNATLRSVDFRGSDLRGSYFRGAHLGGTDFRGADLSGANLLDVHIGYANLNDANLSGAHISGNGIIVFHLTFWCVYIHAATMKIGCQTHTHDEWLSFDDATISKMHENALEWWTEYKPLITAGIKVVKAQVEKKKLSAV